MNRFWQVVLTLLIVTITSVGGPASGQDAEVLNRWYSRGVHAYFAGRLGLAEQMLSRAIDAGTEDPRAYYFRAMARLRQGRRAEASADLSRGADLEVRDSEGIYPVGRSLERVQGQQRLIIESHRRRARTVAFRQRQQRLQQRYDNLQHRETDVLRRQITVPLEQLGVSPETPAVSVPPAAPRQPVRERAPATAPATPPPSQPTGAPAPRAADDGPRPDVVTVPADQKLDASQLGSTLMRILSRAVSEEDETGPPDGADRGLQPPPALPKPAPAESEPAQLPDDPEDALNALFDEPAADAQPATDPAEGFGEEIEGEAPSEDNPFLDDPEPADDAASSDDEPSDLDELFSDP